MNLPCKVCSRCGVTYIVENTKDFSLWFPRDNRKQYGVAYACKACKAEERKAKRPQEDARWHRYYAKGSEHYERHKIRTATRKKHGSAKRKRCCKCNNHADEWHHSEYEIDDVSAFCHPCHTSLHN